MPKLILGTAMWAWTLSKESAFEILDHFYEAGFREVDAATNYPLNGNADHFRLSENILLAWLTSRKVDDLKVMMKVGSLSNRYVPDHNLKPSFLLLNWQQYLEKFGSNLDTFMIHWDNRKEEDEIRESLQIMKQINESGLKIGFSGVQAPALYHKVGKELGLKFRIQMKHNLLQSDYPRYPHFHGSGLFNTYGINAGGMKLSNKPTDEKQALKARGKTQLYSHPVIEDLEKLIAAMNSLAMFAPISTMNEIAMSFACLSPDIEGVLIGPRTLNQLRESLDFYKALQAPDYQLLYEGLLKIHRKYAEAGRRI